MKVTRIVQRRLANAVGHLVEWLVQASPEGAWTSQRSLNKWVSSPVAKQASESLGIPLSALVEHFAGLEEQEFKALAEAVVKAKTEVSIRGLIKGDYYLDEDDVDEDEEEGDEEEGDYVYDPETDDEDPDVEADGLYPYEYPIYDPNGPSYFTQTFYRPPIIQTLWRYGSVSDIIRHGSGEPKPKEKPTPEPAPGLELPDPDEPEEHKVSEVIRDSKAWEKLPKGWDESSAKKAWKSLGGSVKDCMKKMDGQVDNPAAFCASLKDKVMGSTKWRKGPKKGKK